MSVLVESSSRGVLQVTVEVEVATHVSRTGELIRIHLDPAAFAGALERSALTDAPTPPRALPLDAHP